jgi:DNA polymerase-3 subunit beta
VWIKGKIIHRVIHMLFIREIDTFRSFPRNPQVLLLILLFIFNIKGEEKKMKFICEKEKILKGINSVINGVASKTTMPVLEGILIQTNDNELKLTSYDLEIGIEYILEADVEEQGTTVVNAIMFSEIIRKLPNKNIKIAINENNLLEIECEGSLYKLATMNPDEFPELPKINVDNSIEIEQTVLKNMIRKTIFAVSTEENRPIFTGCLFEVQDNKLNVVAVDGYRLAIKSSEINERGNDFSSVIPGKTLNEVNKIISDSFDTVKIGISKNQALFEMENCKIVTRLLDGEFLKYSNTIPSTWETRIKVNKNNILECFERIILISASSIEKEKKYPVKVNVEVGKVTISCANQTGDAKEEIYVETEGKELEIGFNPRFFLDALKAIDDEEVYIEFGTNRSPCIIKPVEDGDYIYMILPIKMKD